LIGFATTFWGKGDKDVKKEVNKTIGHQLDFLVIIFLEENRNDTYKSFTLTGQRTENH